MASKSSTGCYRNGKFFLKYEAHLLDQIEPKELRDKIIGIWPTKLQSQVTNEQLKQIINDVIPFDPEIREFVKSLKLT